MSTDNTKIRMSVHARVTGYYRPISAWNAGKQREFRDRVMTPVQAIAATRA